MPPETAAVRVPELDFVRPGVEPATAGRAFSRPVRAIIAAYRGLANALLLLGTAGQLLLIFTRNLFGYQPAWSSSGATLALALGGLLYVGLCPSHIAFHFVGDRFAARSRTFRAVGSAVGAVIAGWLLYLGIVAVHDQYVLGSLLFGLEVPRWSALVAVPMMAAVLLIRFVDDLVGQLSGRTPR